MLDDRDALRRGPQHPGHPDAGEFDQQHPAHAWVRSHREQRLPAQQFRTVGRSTVAEMKPRIAQLISRAGHQPAGRVAAARKGPKARVHNRFAVDNVVRGCDVQTDDPIGEVVGGFQLKWIQQQVLHRCFIGLLGDGLDDPACHHQTCVVVGEHRSGCTHLRQPRHGGDVAGHRIVAAPEVLNIVTQPPGGVIE